MMHAAACGRLCQHTGKSPLFIACCIVSGEEHTKEISDSQISGCVENAVERTSGKRATLETMQKCFHDAGD